MTTTHRPDTATLRELACRHGCDPRSITAVLEGRAVRGMAGRRATAAADEWRRRAPRPPAKARTRSPMRDAG